MHRRLSQLAASLLAQAAWLAKSILLVIPFPAGGATDVVGRTVAQKLSAALGLGSSGTPVAA